MVNAVYNLQKERQKRERQQDLTGKDDPKINYVVDGVSSIVVHTVDAT